MDKKVFLRLVWIEAVLLAAMFVLGTGLADFAFVPLLNSPLRLDVLVLLTHIALGTVVTILAVTLYLASRRQKPLHGTAEMASLTGLAFILVSLFSGIALVSISNNAFFEYAMSLGFIIAFGSYLFLLGTLR